MVALPITVDSVRPHLLDEEKEHKKDLTKTRRGEIYQSKQEGVSNGDPPVGADRSCRE